MTHPHHPTETPDKTLDRLNLERLAGLYPGYHIHMLSFWVGSEIRDSDWWHFMPNEWNGKNLWFQPANRESI